jgi:hypothetical protein
LVQEHYTRIVKTAVLLASEIPIIKRRDGKLFVEGDPTQLIMNISVFSDSIILWTNDLEPSSFRKLVFLINNFIVTGISAGYPVRCSLSIGHHYVKHEFTSRTNVHIQTQIMGKGRVKAVNFEKNQNWSGCIIDPEAIKYYDSSVEETPRANSKNMLFMTHNPIIIEYQVPINRAGEEIRVAHSVINWPWGIEHEISSEIIENSFTEYHPDITESVRKKIDNTLKFYSDIRGWTGIKEQNDSGIFIE